MNSPETSKTNTHPERRRPAPGARPPPRPPPVEEKHEDDLWWQGLVAWYNKGDYARAMDLWTRYLRLLVLLDPDETVTTSSSSTTTRWPDVREQGDDDDPVAKLSAILKRVTKCASSDDAMLTTPGMVLPNDGGAAARLSLFLAGCCLDAHDFVTARHHLWNSLQWTLMRMASSAADGPHNSTNTSSWTDEGLLVVVLENTVEELLACFQEDPHLAHCYWKLQHAIVEWILLPQQHRLFMPQSSSITKWLDPYQRPAYPYRPLLLRNNNNNNKAVYPREAHPDWCRALEEHWHVIEQEFQALFHVDSGTAAAVDGWSLVGAGTHRAGAGAHDGSVVDVGKWHEIVLAGATGAQPERAPRTLQVLRRYCRESVLSLAEAGAGEVIFSLLQPHTHLRPHTASHNLRLTAHLGLMVPDQKDTDRDCCLQVAGEPPLHWQPGKMLVFDDSYQHAVTNDTDQVRAVLLLRFWHPQLHPMERTTALQTVLTLQEHDRLGRCNPPWPGMRTDPPAVTNRGLHQSHCPQCGRTGYESMRITLPEELSARTKVPQNRADSHPVRMNCVCGALIAAVHADGQAPDNDNINNETDRTTYS